jgi:DNA modification methylase
MLKIEYIKEEDLKPYANNAKIHTAEQVEQIKKSIEEFGFNDPVAVWHDNEIIEGHGRLMAVMDMDDITEVPIIRLDELTDEQRKAYMLIHNKLTMNTDFDIDVLNSELEDIMDINMTDFGFDYEEEQKELKEVKMPEKVQQRCKEGDVWILGKHRLVCGSSTNSDDVGILMEGKRSKLLFTSPPYSDMREYNGDKDLSVDNICSFISKFKEYCDIQAVNLGIQRKDGEIYTYWDSYIEESHKCGLKLLSWCVWDKLSCGAIGMQKAMIPIRHEWIFVFGEKPIDINYTWKKKDASIIANAGKRKTSAVRQKDGSITATTSGITNKAYKKMETVLDIDFKEDEELCLTSVVKQKLESGAICKKHPAPFPVFLPAEYIASFTEEKDIVVEPFGGSGTTLMACEQLGRICYIMELDPSYCDVIIQRWEDFTGEKAVLVESFS